LPIPDFREQRVLVTGAAGFIGSHLVDALVARGASVRALDNLVNGRRENLTHHGLAVEFVEGDIRDAATCRRACQDAAYVFHQAALGSVPRSLADPATALEVNVAGTANLFVAARDQGVARVIYASSSSVYGDSETLPKREGEEGRPLSPYALSKRMNEELAELFGRCFGMKFVGLRYFNVYGPRQDPDGPYAAVLPRFFKASYAGESPMIYGDGEQSRDFTFVSDAVEANLLAAGAAAEACGRAYNVAAGRRTTVNDLARAVRESVGGAPEPRHEAARPGDVRHSLADGSLAKQFLGFASRVSLADGLARTTAHYAELARGSGVAASQVPTGSKGSRHS
jgi:UDP-N-acetylglucosamine/UDP-N-acetyl-alpha-D-glucosaminouronate 4-epimerase